MKSHHWVGIVALISGIGGTVNLTKGYSSDFNSAARVTALDKVIHDKSLTSDEVKALKAGEAIQTGVAFCLLGFGLGGLTIMGAVEKRNEASKPPSSPQ